jgi:hypothetical protein
VVATDPIDPRLGFRRYETAGGNVRHVTGHVVAVLGTDRPLSDAI